MIKNIFDEQLKNISQKELYKNIPLKSLKYFNPNKKILSDREMKIIERPGLLMQTERYYSTPAMRLFNAGKLELSNVTEIEFPQKTKQLGEKAQIYGKILSRTERLIHEGNYELSDESLVIVTSWRRFTDGLSASERRDVIRYRDYFLRILFYTHNDGRITVQEKPLLMINFSYRTNDGRLANLKNTNDIHDIQSIETIELRLNREVYGCLHKYLEQKNEKKKGKIGGGGVRKSIANLPDILSQRINFYKSIVIQQSMIDLQFRKDIFSNENLERIKKIIQGLRYSDRMRIAFERIIDVLYTGIKRRKADQIYFGEEIYNLLFVSKHAGDNIRFSYIILIFNIILNDMEAVPSLFLTTEKHGQNLKNLHADLNLKRL